MFPVYCVKSRRKQPERNLVRRPCIARLRQLQALGAFKHWDFFKVISPPDPGQLNETQKRAYKLDGYEKGVFDINIVCATKKELKFYMIECKHGRNGFTPEQKELYDAAKNTSITAVMVKSIDEFDEFLKKEGIVRGIS